MQTMWNFGPQELESHRPLYHRLYIYSNLHILVMLYNKYYSIFTDDPFGIVKHFFLLLRLERKMLKDVS